MWPVVAPRPRSRLQLQKTNWQVSLHSKQKSQRSATMLALASKKHSPNYNSTPSGTRKNKHQKNCERRLISLAKHPSATSMYFADYIPAGHRHTSLPPKHQSRTLLNHQLRLLLHSANVTHCDMNRGSLLLHFTCYVNVYTARMHGLNLQKIHPNTVLLVHPLNLLGMATSTKVHGLRNSAARWQALYSRVNNRQLYKYYYYTIKIIGPSVAHFGCFSCNHSRTIPSRYRQCP